MAVSKNELIQKIINDDVEPGTIRPSFQNHAPMRHIEAVCVMDRVQADLVSLDNISDKSTCRYVLSVIDIFSRFLWLQALPNKSSESVSAAMKEIFM